ncbi:hypothetical protein CPAR01_03465 [Colletotrichum paranaense]|uniref:Uncharacterized protein n=3 Tax=Colletotrichum acutatum species complex TaxID=2707335 RepID=A0AAJ0DVV8_9PEZI|nr:uncharacterized protein CCOS01_12529 [Colletotrichum costaricense]XP_060355080.1 uncharacterized protein CPAR01_03465 [Colletotrichum paranaense]XP_060399752.1 uncharacterized protein CABS01_09697 [Colletotrichum abscissum]KAI3539045.1 hypothetical protein CSPX01_09172 [Colletotrichum filicis]KAK1461151.1 hypothetical protein CMEL01_14787 [Colletotrichum melonis]KAK1500962.1 hypothetical protein CABS01_09697 [Colletotrichum abscissum]KAK1516980.1 hypothetical protein CCOS01_12529 [Colletot
MAAVDKQRRSASLNPETSSCRAGAGVCLVRHMRGQSLGYQSHTHWQWVRSQYTDTGPSASDSFWPRKEIMPLKTAIERGWMGTTLREDDISRPSISKVLNIVRDGQDIVGAVIIAVRGEMLRIPCRPWIHRAL